MVGDRAEHEALSDSSECLPLRAQQIVVARLLSLAPDVLAAISRRCGHSISTGGTARNSGPGKLPLLPMPDWLMASSAASSASAPTAPAEQRGSALMKSTVPAMGSSARRSESA